MGIFKDNIFWGKSWNYLACAIKFQLLALVFILPIFLNGCGWETIKNNNQQESVSVIHSPDKGNVSENIGNKSVKILFLGDMMFDRSIRRAAQKHGGDYNYIFSDIKNNLAQYDLVVGNLEGPITEKYSVSVGTAMDEKKNLVFSFDPSVAKNIFENNIKLVNLGNNHIFNQGEDGIVQTKKYLDGAGTQYFGDTGNGSQEYIIREMGKMGVSFVNYNYSVAGSLERAIEDIKSVRDESDVVIVCPHWGIEYKTGDPGQTIKDEAYKFIDAGADLVIGTHPHVVQNSETYKGKKIYYSLGNFIFDQYFSPDTMHGLAVAATIDPASKGISFSEIPVVVEKNGKTEFK